MIFKIHYIKSLNDFFFFVGIDDPDNNIGMFLHSEVFYYPGSTDFYIEEIEGVLAGKKTSGEATGNAYTIDIYPKMTKISFLFSDETCDNKGTWIETEKLRSYIFLWFNELQKFHHMYMHPLRGVFDPDYGVYTFLASVYHKQVDFKESFLFYINSESAKAIRQTKKMVQHFLAVDACLAQKRAYIEYCADGVDFKKDNIDPLVWLEDQLQLFPKSNKYVDAYIWPVIDAITTELVQFKKWIFNER